MPVPVGVANKLSEGEEEIDAVPLLVTVKSDTILAGKIRGESDEDLCWWSELPRFFRGKHP